MDEWWQIRARLAYDWQTCHHPFLSKQFPWWRGGYRLEEYDSLCLFGDIMVMRHKAVIFGSS
jgi:hypothetical protein